MFIVLIIGICLAFFIWEQYYKRNWDRDVKVTLSFSNESIYAGEHTKLVEVIENRKRMPLPVLEVGFHTKKDLVFQNADNTYVSDNTYKRDIFACLGKQKITRQIDVRGKKRGYYEIETADVTAFSLLHDKRYSKTLNCKTALYVYPARVKAEDILVICERMLGNLQCSKHLYEDPFAFRSIREYMIDDPMKTINWNASARTGKLMVNTFDSVLTQRAFVFLDLEDSSILKHEHLVEYSISLAATLSYKLLSRNMELGMASNAGISMEAANGKKQMSNLERMLALYEEPKNGKYESIINVINEYNEKFASDTDVIFIFISKNNTEEMKKTIVSFLGKERQGIWVCPVTYGEPKPEIEIKATNLKVLLKEVAR